MPVFSSSNLIKFKETNDYKVPALYSLFLDFDDQQKLAYSQSGTYVHDEYCPGTHKHEQFCESAHHCTRRLCL